MGSKICMNESCRLTTSSEWKQGWGLKSGGFATLCSNCGTAYENFAFCEKFHLDEDGWRECRICRKRIHCGCVASKMLLEHLDLGGVGCTTCVKRMHTPSIGSVQILRNEIPNRTLIRDVQRTTENVIVHKSFNDLIKICENINNVNGAKRMFKSQKVGTSSSLGQNKGAGTVLPLEDVNTCSPNFTPQSVGSSMLVKPDISKQNQGFKDMGESLAQPSLNFSLSNAPSTSGSVLPISDGIVEGSGQNKVSPIQQAQRSLQILSKPAKPCSSSGSEATKGMASQIRIAKPPAEGRGRGQLLPRYWPRITEQELRQICGDLKSTIVPLFEKVLSASDAGRIGRLVLPKACAEAYFPHINQSDGVPISVKDVKGQVWMFQFRFWPNNNSRMYVLEGVTPCIQNLQLQAGDTVTFSRIDPGGQLVMGFRKSTGNVDIQDQQPSGVANGGSSGETSNSGASDNMLAITENGKNGSQIPGDSSQQPILIPEKKKARNIGPKNKRLHMHSDDANELSVTWKEAQELLRPPTNSPTIINIEDYEFEEYNEPPIIGKRTIFTVQPSGLQEQWAQCDNCSRWRRLPMHILVPAKWTCSDNEWGSNISCFAPDEINPTELEDLNIASNDVKRRRNTETYKAEDFEPSGLDALATAAVLGDNIVDLTENETSVGATTKHPRHREGCSCIVCIQPPSGKGKHPPACKCNVCLTVKRRFKTLTMRKKRRQLAREAEPAKDKDQEMPIEITGMEGTAEPALLLKTHSDTEKSQNVNLMEVGESKKGQLDLNCHPTREEDMLAEAAAGLNMDSLIDAARIPLDMYMRQNGAASLSHHLVSHVPSGGEGCSTSAGMGKGKDY